MQPDLLSVPMCDALRASPFLAEFQLTERDVTARRYPAGRFVSDYQGRVPCVGMVAAGQIDVYSAAVDGRDVRLTTLLRGDCFGIYNLMAEEELATLLRCAEETVVFYVPKRTLLSQLAQEPARALRYASLCGGRIRFLLQRISQLTIQSCRGKIISYLLSAADEQGRVPLRGSREELAKHLGVSRAALFRELAALQELRAVGARGHALLVLDRPLLERMLYGL